MGTRKDRMKGWWLAVWQGCASGAMTLNISTPGAWITIRNFRPGRITWQNCEPQQARQFIYDSSDPAQGVVLVLGEERNSTCLRVGAVEWYSIPKAFAWRLRDALMGKVKPQLQHEGRCGHFQQFDGMSAEEPAGAVR